MTKENFYKIKWGEIHYCDLGKAKGSVQCGRRPVMVVQTNLLNKHSPTVLVAVITSVKKKENVDNHILLGTDCGLKEPSMLMLEQLRTVDKAEELEEFIGKVTDEDKINEIKKGLKYTVGIPMRPKRKRQGIILSLCPRCRSEFFAVPENILRRVDPLQSEKEVCDKCQVGYGYDYFLMKREKRSDN
jgi:mRNA interferase MazF